MKEGQASQTYRLKEASNHVEACYLLSCRQLVVSTALFPFRGRGWWSPLKSADECLTTVFHLVGRKHHAGEPKAPWPLKLSLSASLDENGNFGLGGRGDRGHLFFRPLFKLPFSQITILRPVSNDTLFSGQR